MDQAKVAFVVMPFGTVQYPSIQAGLLKAIAERDGIKVDCHYLNLSLAKIMEPRLYNFLSSYRGPLLGEWMFSAAAFGDSVPPPEEFVKRYAEALDLVSDRGRTDLAALLEVRETLIPEFLDEEARRIVVAGYEVVCFTSTFEQNVAGIALARRLKSLRPSLQTVFGGSNFDGEMGRAYVEGVQWIDVAVSGEADHVFSPLLSALLAGHEIPSLDGIILRDASGAQAHRRATFEGRMDDLPIPDYSEYFKSLEVVPASYKQQTNPITLLIEGSRGCWWGDKHHCKFCGLNGLGMRFRSKSTQRIIEDIEVLSERHRIARINAVDNIIGREQTKQLTQYMKSKEMDYDLFFEIKANLSRDEIQALSEGCITHVQPGIESFSSHVLKLMDKGITGIQNVNSLRWFAYYGVHAFWNLIFGFPGESRRDYEDQRDLIQKLHFLPPPRGIGPIWIERFSPYFRDATEGRHFHGLRPHDSYKYAYPATVDVHRAAYFFEAELIDAVDKSSVSSLTTAVKDWRERWQIEPLPTLVYQKLSNGVRIVDGRSIKIKSYFYTDLLACAFLFCVDRPRSASNIFDQVTNQIGNSYSASEVGQALSMLVSREFIIQEGDLYLALPLPLRRGRRASEFRGSAPSGTVVSESEALMS
ncbi:RiPP maturation radical SAM protein 1 [Rhizobium sp. KAs_5_22]|uniref:RiPP maturation radical SAM C-methyltransferase n=1 Tax=Ciceribacter selenitireducens TaxID=448181 RepID=UPI0004B8DCC6|nr:RiPP maturation radical SAM C-methyltransferase [Ciceribacter selenitireducens]PPJ46401.1 RiPP maturation radical SAM protein 1 [Rhizobium sp. KAs_5_22]